eukprot:gene33461-43246_t
MKSGTTSLSKALRDHSKFCDDEIKEKHFFSVPSNYAKGVDWYIKEFPQNCRSATDLLSLDATPTYIYTHNVSNLIGNFYSSQELAKKKFILILRDPVARLYSEYQFWLRWCLWRLFNSPGKTSAVLNGRECQHVTPSSNFNLNITTRNISEVADQLLTFSEFLQTTNGKVCLEKSEYHTHIRNWLKVIRRDQLFIIGFATLTKRSVEALTALSSFLDIPNWESNYSYPMSNKHTDYDSGIRCSDRNRLVAHFEPEYEELARFINSGAKHKSEPRFEAFDQKNELPKCT